MLFYINCLLYKNVFYINMFLYKSGVVYNDLTSEGMSEYRSDATPPNRSLKIPIT